MEKGKKDRKKPSIAEIEAILNQEDISDKTIRILPNGEIQSIKKTKGQKFGKKPLTMRENLGGEYTDAA